MIALAWARVLPFGTKPKLLEILISRAQPLARSERFELPTLGFEVRCSIQLSYERVSLFNGLAGHPNSLGAELGTEKAAETPFGFLDYQTWPERAMEGESVPARDGHALARIASSAAVARWPSSPRRRSSGDRQERKPSGSSGRCCTRRCVPQHPVCLARSELIPSCACR